MSSENVLLLEDASLAVKEDSLVITDKRGLSRKQKGARQGCCGVVADGSSKDSNCRAVLLYHVLWAEAVDGKISISIAEKVGASKLVPETITYKYAAEEEADTHQWVEMVLSLAYGDAQKEKRLKVVINPFGGPGKARKIYSQVEGLLQSAQCHLDVIYTTHHEHAISIAETLDIDACDAVVCVSGDGVVHEIFNGFARRPDAARALRKVAVCQLAGGTGNAMCWNLTGTGNPAYATLSIIKGVRSSMDLVSITQGEKRFLSFLSQAVGIVAEVDLGTEDMRWMGSTRFTVGFLQRIMREAIYPADVAFKVVAEDKEEIRKLYRSSTTPAHSEGATSDEAHALPDLKYGTVKDPVPEDWTSVHLPQLGNFFAGNMAIVSEKTNFFPASRPNDGMMDLICIAGTIGRMKAVELLLAVETGKHFNSESVGYRKIMGYRITPRDQKDGYISIDGEKVPFEPFQAEIHPGLATVLCKRPNMFENVGV